MHAINRVGSQEPLRPSLLDRLIDQEPDVSTEPAWRRTPNLREFEHCVLRDVVALLNTRQSRSTAGTDFRQLPQSVLTYGLPDFTTVGGSHIEDFEQLRVAIEEAIAHFEPRIRQVQVRFRERTDELDRSLQMVVEGMLWVEPEPVPITFDAVVEPLSGDFKVQSR